MRRSVYTALALAALSSTLVQGCIITDCTDDDGDSRVCLETPVRYEGELRETAIAYEPGLGVSIDGVYGNVRVREGSYDEVRVISRPFAYAGHGQRDRALAAIEDKAVFPRLVVREERIEIRSDHRDADIPLVGVELEIQLPPDFEGPILAQNRGDGTWNPGDVRLDFVGYASRLEVRTGPLGECWITGGPAVTDTFARCGDSIHVRGVNDTVDLRSTGAFGDIRVELEEIWPGVPDSSIVAEGGRVEVRFPFDADFDLGARAWDQVDLSAIEGRCATAASAESSKSARCGLGGPPFFDLVSEDESVRVSFH